MWILVAIGALFALRGTLLLRGIPREFALLKRMRHEGVQTTGIVVRHVPEDEGIDQPVIQFPDRAGNQVEFSPDPAHVDKFVAQGKRFPVIYLEDRPDEAKLSGLETRHRGLLSEVAVGVAYLGAAVVMLSGELPSETIRKGPGSALAWVYLLAVILAFGYPAWRHARSLRSLLFLRREGVHTTGTVLRVSRRERMGWGAVVEFFDADGRRVQFACRSSKQPLGRTVPVVYPPGSPEDAHHDRLAHIVVRLMALSTLGLVILTSIGYAMFFA